MFACQTPVILWLYVLTWNEHGGTYSSKVGPHSSIQPSKFAHLFIS